MGIHLLPFKKNHLEYNLQNPPENAWHARAGGDHRHSHCSVPILVFQGPFADEKKERTMENPNE
jgi:hypothetical protein